MSASPMTTISSTRTRSDSDSFHLWIRGFSLLACCGLLVFFVFSAGTPDDGGDRIPESPKIVTVKTAGARSAGHLVEGSLNGIDYIHCGAHTDSATRDVILLHGAKFTKQDWKKSKIFDRLCANGKLTVTALDLPVQSDGKALQNLLKALAVGEDLLCPEGGYVVVTPSASGKSIVDWINTGNLDELTEMVGLWIPIASPAIETANVDRLHALQKESWSVLALYGDQDPMGKRVSERLQKEVGATIMEFPGPHAFYFGIAETFSSYVLKELKVV